MKAFYIILISLLALQVFGQDETVGLLQNSEEAYNGYVLFSPLNSTKSYLIDNCGYVVHEWQCDNTPYYTSYLMENGNLVRIGQSNPSYVEIRDWDSNLLWRYYTPFPNGSFHSDLAFTEDGNILIVFDEFISAGEWNQLGGNPSFIYGQAGFEGIVELEPIGSDDANIVWEWHFMDHMIQDFDDTKENYGVIAEHPEKLDVNLEPTIGSGFYTGWQHVNGIDYNDSLKQIAISCWTCSEVFIIDHTTTISEAASSQGGFYGKGGDFLWRWGNPANYDKGTQDDQFFFGQHNPFWIKDGYPNAGMLTVFENGNGRPGGSYSRVVILDPSMNNNFEFEFDAAGKFLPEDLIWQWNGDVLGDLFYTQYMGGVNIQPNGNMTVCQAIPGKLFEVNPEGDIVWIYQNPDAGSFQTQGITPNSHDLYRGEKYPPDYPAFEDKELNPIGIIEDYNSISDSCLIYPNPEPVDTTTMDTVTGILAIDQTSTLIYPNPTSGIVNIETALMLNQQVFIYDIQGKLVKKKLILNHQIDLSDFENGNYFIEWYDVNGRHIEKISKL